VQVLVRDNNVDQALKALKKKMQREGIFREMKLRGHYEKPSGEGGSDPPCPQAGAQTAAARGPVADEAETRDCRPRRRSHRGAARSSLRLRHRSFLRKARAPSVRAFCVCPWHGNSWMRLDPARGVSGKDHAPGITGFRACCH
jgi:ribosomal protein S21